jgi:hypothetical protein
MNMREPGGNWSQWAFVTISRSLARKFSKRASS